MGILILLLVVGAVVYFFASARSRREAAVESRVKKMISAGVGSATFADLYYEAAKAYAVSKGAKAADHESAAAKIVIDGCVYFVFFMRDSGGRTVISAERDSDVTKRILDDMSRW